MARVVIAIDFGTSRSGYAYAFPGDPNKAVYGELTWEGQPAPYPKTLTEILYGLNGQLMQWGFQARNELALLSPQHVGDLALLRRFKMALYSESHNRNVQGSNGRSFDLFDVIRDYLKLIGEKALEKVQANLGGGLNRQDVLWCLTVPAIWNDRDKRVMRQAFHRAGLIDAEESDKLLITLEPEAAALYCQARVPNFAPRPGQNFMIVDCGGGTVDITVHQVRPDNRLSEVVPGTGGPFGSTYVDQRFSEHLDAKFGKSLMDEFRRTRPPAEIELLSKWERIKCEFGPGSNRTIYLPLEPSLLNLLAKNPQVRDAFEAEQGGDIDSLHLSPSLMRSFFEPVLDGIEQSVDNALNAMRGQRCDFLLIVGGFGESKLLQERISARFSSRVGSIIVPPSPSKAIVEGAALYGLAPETIGERRSRLTYGCDFWTAFEAHIDPEGKKRTLEDGSIRCADRYDIFVKVGDLIAMDQVVRRRYVPLSANQSLMTISLYATPKTYARYTDENDVQYLGNCTVEMPDLRGGRSREVEVTMKFGSTEILVDVRDITSGSTAETRLNFSTSFHTIDAGASK